MVEVTESSTRPIGPLMTICWYLLDLLFHGVKLVEFQRVYGFHKGIAGVVSENAMLKVLKRLEFYGLVRRESRGVLYTEAFICLYTYMSTWWVYV